MTAPAGRDATVVRLAALGALAGFCAFHWANLLADPPVARVLGVVAIAAATAAALARLGRRPQTGVWRHAAALAISLAGIAAGLVAVGIAPRLLAPAGWERLTDGVGRGLVELGDVTYPYDGGPGWPRLVVLLALPVLLGLAAALAFWPADRRGPRLQAVGLGVLIASYGIAVVLYAPGLALLHGFVLLVLIAAWLWAPRVAGRRAAIAAVAIAAAGVLAVPVARAVDRSSPILDYRSWSWTGSTPSVGFNWNHSYKPLDWPREGTPLLDVRSEAPHYWRAVVLERFDGFRWVRLDPPEGTALELPNRAESGYIGQHDEWFETTEVTVRELRSGLVVGPGSVQNIEGLNGAIAGDGTALAGGVPNSGQSYTVTSYAPDPSAAQMREAPDDYATTLTRFTELDLPTERIPITSASQSDEETPAVRRLLIQSVPVPLRGEPLGPSARLIRSSAYGDVFALSRALTRDAPTAYDAVRAVERHLQSGYTYTETPPESERPLRSFLLTDRAGYCQQFSGAMALMLRMSGIPARVVSGFSPGAPDVDQPGVFTVRDTDAHSWTEVYFMGIGWVPFDPTPPASPARSQTALNAIAATPGDIPGGPNRRAREPGSRDGVPVANGSGGLPWEAFAAIPALLALAGLAIGLVLARRRLRFRALSPSERAEAQVRELASAFDGTRYRSRDGATLLRLERQLRGGSRSATARYASRLRAFRFAPETGPGPTLRERRAARRELGASRGLRSRLRLIAAMPPGGPATPPPAPG